MEIEVKFRVDSFDSIEKRLEKAGFTNFGSSEESTILYDDNNGKWKDAGITVRTKTINGKTTFTVKKKVAGKFKSAIEKECFPDVSIDEFKEMLGMIDLFPDLEYSKTRNHFKRDNVAVELDHIEETGEKFIELEAPDEETLENLISELDLTGLKPDIRSYSKIIREHRENKTN